MNIYKIKYLRSMKLRRIMDRIKEFFPNLAYKIRVNKFKKILRNHDMYELKGYVYKIVDIGDFYVHSVQIRTGWEIAIGIQHIRVKHNGKLVGLSDIGLFF